MFTGPETDRLAIRELLDAYSDAVMRRDRAAWGALWAEDAVWRFHGREIRGREEIVTTWDRAMAAYDGVWFSAFPGSIAVSGDSADLRSNTFEYLRPSGGTPRLQAGLYQDRVVRDGDRWIFAERTFTAWELTL